MPGRNLRHAKSSTTLREIQKPTKIIIPDLVSECPFPLRCSTGGAIAGESSNAWLSARMSLGSKKRVKLQGLKCGLLTAMTYPDAPLYQLRTVCDFLSYLFHLDDLSDGMDRFGTLGARKVVIASMCDPTFDSGTKLGRMARDIWERILPFGSPGMKARFISTFELFFRAVAQQARDRKSGVIMDLESYMILRRDTSGCRPCWAMIEYANGLDLPDDVMEHELVEILGEATNDLVSWSNDIFSFKVESARNDTHNMISISMSQFGISLQDAFDHVGNLCSSAISRFLDAKQRLPSFDSGGPIDKDLARYVRGLEDWMVGSLHWSFESSRYFGATGRGVKLTRTVKLDDEKRRAEFLKRPKWSCMTHPGGDGDSDLESYE